MQGHYFDIYVNSPTFPEPWPAPQMAGVDPIAHQKAKQARLRQREQQTAASAAGVGLQGGSMGVHESMAAESGVQQAKRTAVSTDAETAHGPAKRVSASAVLLGMLEGLRHCWSFAMLHAGHSGCRGVYAQMMVLMIRRPHLSC